MTLLKWARVWVNHDSVATVAKLYFTEALWCNAIVDKNVVRFDVCRLIRNDVRARLGGLHNTRVDITTAVQRF